MIETRFLKKNKIDEETKIRILGIIKECICSINGIVFAYLHGSFAEGADFRDIDIALFVEESVNKLEIETTLSYELTEKTGCPVEVRVVNDAPVAFQMAVLRRGVLLLSRSEDIRTNFIEKISRKYCEYVHFRNIILGA
ncbi:MAG: nucleotidyltransferase domain-containing protein [Candidatus Brocadia sp.]|jgi:hypothetical protein